MINELEKIVPNTKHGIRNPLMNKPGCYCVEHNLTGKKYIGSSGNIGKRISQTTSALRKNTHKNVNLQNLYNEDNEINIYVKVTDQVETARTLEQQLVNVLKDGNLLCNVATNDVTRTNLGVKLSDKHKSILNECNKNRIVTDSTKQKMSDTQKALSKTEKGKELLKNRIKNICKKVCIAGVDYESISEASRSLNIPYTTLVRKYNL